MSKKIVNFAIVALLLVATSCATKESAYKAAYEQAKERPVVQTPAEEQATKPVVSQSRSVERSEKVSVIDPADAAGLKQWNVVVGSFQNNTNATALKEFFMGNGYTSFLVKNSSDMLRVIVASFDEKEQAATIREKIKTDFPGKFTDAWLLKNE